MSAARRKALVEPLSRPAWERVESSLFSRLEQGEHLLPAPAAAARRAAWPGRVAPLAAFAVAAAAVALLWWRAPAGLAVPLRADLGEQLARPEGARIVTTLAPVEASVGDSVLTIAEHSVVRVEGDDDKGWLVRLHEGRVDCQVAARRARPAFVVEAGDTRVRVIGTRFSVLRAGSGARVAVAEGTVWVESRGQSVRLAPGDIWSSTSLDGTAAAAPSVAPESSVANAAVSEPASDVVASDVVAVVASDAAAASREPAAAARGRARPRESAQQRFERAARLEASKPDLALRMYRELGRVGAWAPNALYARARLELELGRAAAAERHLTRYLELYPSGANAADVRGLLRKLDPVSH